MRARKLQLLIFLLALVRGEWLGAQEYLDLWRKSGTDNFYLVQQKFNEYFAGRDSGAGYKQFKRWEEFMAPRVYPSGKLINPEKLALDEALRYGGLTANNQRATAHAGNWRSLGIKNYTYSSGAEGVGMGRVNCIVPHPTDPETLFIGTPAGGIWKTTDGGSNWTPLSDGIPVLGISGIAINSRNADSIYILTGDGDGSNTASTGVLLSTNGGDTWQSTGLQWDVSENVLGFKLLMHPGDNRILFAVTNRGIYKTINSGVTWSLKQPDFFTDIVFKPGSSSVMYATAYDSYFYSSYDGGETWQRPSIAFPGRSAIGVTTAFPNAIYLISGTNTGYTGTFLSTDGGVHWDLLSNSPNILSDDVIAPFDTWTQAEYDLAIAVSPNDPLEVHVGGINCWKTVDAGANWKYTSIWQRNKAPAGNYTHADIHALVFSGSKLYCASDGGVYYSDDNAGSWHDISAGLEISQFYTISTTPNNLNMLYAGAQDVGLNKWTAAAPATLNYNLGGDVVSCVVDYTNENIVYALSQKGKFLFQTENGGANWDISVAGSLNAGYVVPLIMHPTDHTKLYAGYDRVLLMTKSPQGGLDVSAASPVFKSPLVALGMSAANPSYMYAATPTSLSRCLDVTATSTLWKYVTGTLPVNVAQISDVEVSPLDVTKLWVSFSSYSGGNKMYYSSDTGATWTNISGTLPNVPVNCIAYHNNGNDGIYIGTDIGVFYRDNTMTDWIPFRNGLPNVVIRDLEITLNKMRAATFGRGIWESDLDGTCPVNVARTIDVSGNQFSANGNVITPCTCADDYTLSGDVVGYQSFQASNTVTSTADIMGGVGTEVYYTAANKITLNTGFKVASESRFLAATGNCNSPGSATRQRQYRGVYEGVMPGALGIASVADSLSLSSSANRLKVYPNPFSRQSTLEFYIANQTPVTISLWDLSGKEIKILFRSSLQPSGNYQVRLDAGGLGSGVYFVRLQTRDYQETKKIVITK